MICKRQQSLREEIAETKKKRLEMFINGFREINAKLK